jgi:hypothetical protein
MRLPDPGRVAGADLLGRPVVQEKFWRPDQIMAALAYVGLQHEMHREHQEFSGISSARWSNELRHRLRHGYSLRYRSSLDPTS